MIFSGLTSLNGLTGHTGHSSLTTACELMLLLFMKSNVSIYAEQIIYNDYTIIAISSFLISYINKTQHISYTNINNYYPKLEHPGPEFVEDDSAISNLIFTMQKVTIMQVFLL